MLSIIIVSFNAGDDLDRCLRSLHAAPPAHSHETIVVDNGSRDESVAMARRWSGVHVIENGANVGFAAATNIGIRASRGDLLLLLNSDTIVPAGSIDRLIAEIAAHPDVSVIGPRLVDELGRPELSFGPMITPLAEWRQKRLRRNLAAVDRLTRVRRRPDWVSGACLLVRRTDAEAVGLLDERFFLYTEDVDFCAAIRARGRHILFLPDTEVVHLRGRSRASAPATAGDAYRRSRMAFYQKHHPLWAPSLRLYLWLRRAISSPRANRN
jgi:GT2 family glycosyltransferase